jgi:hypothetical protein
VFFIDKPTGEAQTGIWGVPVAGGAPGLVTARLGIYSTDNQYLAFPKGGQTVVERLADGQQWTIPSEGRAVDFSQDAAWVAWTAGQPGPPFDTLRREIWISHSDGSQPTLVQSVYGGGFSGWLGDGRLLFSGRPSLDETVQGIWAVPVSGGDPVLLAKAERFRSIVASPDGSWMAYQVAFTSDPQANGLWVVNTTSLETQRLPVYGAFRWRSSDRLLVIPLDPSQPVQTIWEFQFPSGQSRPLTDPARIPLKIANGDWSVSPNGQYVVYVSSEDLNLWLLQLP